MHSMHFQFHPSKYFCSSIRQTLMCSKNSLYSAQTTLHRGQVPVSPTWVLFTFARRLEGTIGTLSEMLVFDFFTICNLGSHSQGASPLRILGSPLIEVPIWLDLKCFWQMYQSDFGSSIPPNLCCQTSTGHWLKKTHLKFKKFCNGWKAKPWFI